METKKFESSVEAKGMRQEIETCILHIHPDERPGIKTSDDIRWEKSLRANGVHDPNGLTSFSQQIKTNWGIEIPIEFLTRRPLTEVDTFLTEQKQTLRPEIQGTVGNITSRLSRLLQWR